MVQEELFELEIVIRSISFLIIFGVLMFVSIAYYRTRIQRLLILFLLGGLLAINILLDMIEHLTAVGISFFGLITSTLGLIIALLLLATVVKRFKWEPR